MNTFSESDHDQAALPWTQPVEVTEEFERLWENELKIRTAKQALAELENLPPQSVTEIAIRDAKRIEYAAALRNLAEPVQENSQAEHTAEEGAFVQNLPEEAVPCEPVSAAKRAEPPGKMPNITSRQEATWQEIARVYAKEYIDRHKRQDLHPSQDDVCEHLETRLRNEKIYGQHKTPLSANTIKREAIQGEWWKKNKN